MAKKRTAKKRTAKKRAKTLKTYLVIYHSPPSAMKKMTTASREEMAAGMAAWMKWGEKCGDQLVDFGSPLMGGVNLKAMNRPAPSKRKVSGYSILKAESMAAAKKLLQKHPHLSWAKGCEVEVHEAVPMG